jgi:hypothetical protein
MIFTNGGYLKGRWEKGKLIEKQYFYSDDLPFSENYKTYCTDGDRRFEIEMRKGINPFDETLLLNSENGLKDIPEGTYDVKNGFFDVRRNLVYSYDRKKILRKVDEKEVENIMAKYRYNP